MGCFPQGSTDWRYLYYALSLSFSDGSRWVDDGSHFGLAGNAKRSQFLAKLLFRKRGIRNEPSFLAKTADRERAFVLSPLLLVKKFHDGQFPLVEQTSGSRPKSAVVLPNCDESRSDRAYGDCLPMQSYHDD